MGMFLGGVLNILDPVFGIQLYFWALGFLVALIAVSWYLAKFIMWNPYKPFHGLYTGFKDGSNACMIFGGDLRGEMIDEKEGKCIFDYSKDPVEIDIPDVHSALQGVVDKIYTKLHWYPTKYLTHITPLEAIVFKFGGVNKDVEIAKHLQNGEWERYPSVNCSGVDVDVIIDTDNWTMRDRPQHKAIERCARAWNELNPNDRVESYAKFQKKLMTGEISCPEVRPMSFVSWTRIDAGFPLDLQEADWAGKRRQMAEEEIEAEQMSKNKMAIWLLFGAFGLAVLVLIIRLIAHFF